MHDGLLYGRRRDLLLSAAQTICVIVDSKVVVGRCRRRRAGVCRQRGIAHKARAALSGPSGPCSGRRHRWPLVPRSGRSRTPPSSGSGRPSGPSDLFQPYVSSFYPLRSRSLHRTVQFSPVNVVMLMYHILVQRASASFDTMVLHLCGR